MVLKVRFLVSYFTSFLGFVFVVSIFIWIEFPGLLARVCFVRAFKLVNSQVLPFDAVLSSASYWFCLAGTRF